MTAGTMERYSQLDTTLQKLIDYRKITPHHATPLRNSFMRAIREGRFTEQEVVRHLMDEYELQPGD